jgi:hypothetical protein
MTASFQSPSLGRRHLAGGSVGVLLAQAGTATPVWSQATDATVRQLGGGLAYREIARWEAAQLNRILTVDTPAFSGVNVTYTPARNAVRLYRVTYPSMIPEQDNRRVLLSGLVAVPDVPAGPLRLMSYQHGTVYGKQEVPSFRRTRPKPS